MSPRHTYEDIWGIVLAGGSGSRFGGRKQFLELGPGRLVDHSVSATASICNDVVLVLPPDVSWDGQPVTTVVVGGSTRMASVRTALRSIPAATKFVLIHDAAHPLASKRLIESLIATVQQPGVDAAVAVAPVTDTLARASGGRLIASVPRDAVVTVQAPQAFRADVLRAAHEAGGEASDDSVLVYELGATIRTVPGDPFNVHITTPAELAMAEVLLELTP